MSYIRQKVVGFIRNFSTPHDSKDDLNSTNCFIQRYLKGKDIYRNEPEILHGRTPQELPPREIGCLNDVLINAITGPAGGLTTVNKEKMHISISDPDVHFIDGADEESNDKDVNGSVSIQISHNDFTPLRKSESAPNAQLENQCGFQDHSEALLVSEIAGVLNWDNAQTHAYGCSVTLYELHPIKRVYAGEPIADCFAVIARQNSAILVVADGVNWGQKACIAARAAVHGCVEYLNKVLYPPVVSDNLTTTDIFMTLLRSFNCAHNLIIQEEGMFTTLTAAVVLPLRSLNRYIVCCCNVGDSLAYVYSPRSGVREITQGSHDVHAMRDMRDALGALGPVDGHNPELSNLTLSMTEVEPGDIVFITTDGVSDNLDPVIGKFAGLPNVEAHQRHKLTLLRTEDLLRNGVSGKGPGVKNARELVTTVLDFVTRLTAAKRHILEDIDLYIRKDGKRLTKAEHKVRRKEICGKLSSVPGKLDHATVAAYLVSKFEE